VEGHACATPGQEGVAARNDIGPRGRDSHFSNGSHFSCSVLPPREIIPMFFKGLELSWGIYGGAYECGILTHLAARPLLNSRHK
jgi:hypothetical protein